MSFDRLTPQEEFRRLARERHWPVHPNATHELPHWTVSEYDGYAYMVTLHHHGVYDGRHHEPDDVLSLWDAYRFLAFLRGATFAEPVFCDEYVACHDELAGLIKAWRQLPSWIRGD